MGHDAPSRPPTKLKTQAQLAAEAQQPAPMPSGPLLSVQVSLGGKTYEIKKLPIRANQQWREQLRAPFAEMVDALEGADKFGDLFSQDKDKKQAALDAISLTNVATITRTFAGRLLGSMDLVLDLLFAYSPALQADREHIENHAYDDEALAAFVEVLKLAYPLGRILGVAKALGGL